MTDTSTGSNQPADDSGADEAAKKFEDQTAIGDPYFLFQSWPAYALNTEQKLVLPVSRVCIADTSGNLVFDRSVVFTGVIDLLNELAVLLSHEMSRLDGLGYTIDVPTPKSDLLKNLANARGSIEESAAALEKLSFAEPKAKGG